MVKPNNLSKNAWSDRLIDRLAYAHDASMYRLVPEAVARPKSEQDVKYLLRHANDTKSPVTFRTGGTSLSGQSISNGILAEVVRGWQNYHINDDGNSIELQPGVIGARANVYLAPYQKWIGTDLASINSARIGGIISNNSSGMVCGVKYNSYHTMKNIRFMLANGHVYDTSNQDDYVQFINSEPDLSAGITACKKEIESQAKIVNMIRRKYSIKNTIGYSLNAFIDYNHPLDIFAHLIIGAEGTLAFCSKVELNTIDDPPLKSTGLVLFDSVTNAISSLSILLDEGADAIELMDDASLRTAEHFTNAPYDYTSIKSQSAGLLFEFQRHDPQEIETLMKTVPKNLMSVGGKLPVDFSNDPRNQLALWNIRKGLYPTVGALRKKGTSVINEDLCYDYKDLPKVVNELKSMCHHWKYNDAVLFGHAKDGNLHFATSMDLNSHDGEKRFEGLMNDLVDITIKKFDGSLKAEHGTGRNMAPFVEYEWGGELYNIMWRIKNLADQNHILNPDVLLTKDNKLHLRNLKKIPIVADEIDLCVECGFCEPICPSKELTMTPRQRIAVQREIELGNADSTVLKDFKYDGIDTCATDGLCELSCPVNINTGSYIKSLNHQNHSSISKAISLWSAEHFSLIQSLARLGLKMGKFTESVINTSFMNTITKGMHKLLGVPQWHKHMPEVSSPIHSIGNAKDATWVYYPSCITRVFTGDNDKSSVKDIMLEIAEKCGHSIFIPENLNNTCCSQPFSSKGYLDAAISIQEKTIDLLWNASNKGKLPIVIDTSPCTYQLLHQNKFLDDKTKSKLNDLQIVDIINFLFECVSSTDRPKLSNEVVLHPTCSTEKMDEMQKMKDLAEKCVTKVTIPTHWGCCGFAGDKGLNIPELNQVATHREIDDISLLSHGYSTSRTCEIGMMTNSNISYRSIAYLVRDYLNQRVN